MAESMRGLVDGVNEDLGQIGIGKRTGGHMSGQALHFPFARVRTHAGGDFAQGLEEAGLANLFPRLGSHRIG